MKCLMVCFVYAYVSFVNVCFFAVLLLSSSDEEVPESETVVSVSSSDMVKSVGSSSKTISSRGKSMKHTLKTMPCVHRADRLSKLFVDLESKMSQYKLGKTIFRVDTMMDLPKTQLN
jgi:hypothetical protein